MSRRKGRQYNKFNRAVGNAKKTSRKQDPPIVVMFTFLSILIIQTIALIIYLLMIGYDAITIYTTKYREKSGNGFFKTYFNKGNYGEFKLYRKIIKIFGKDKVYPNLYLENVNTDHTEIDVVALSKHGVYVFEMKNYSGWIYGSEKNEQWTQTFNRFSKFRFYNPLRQNYGHTKAVERYLNLNDEGDTIPVVVFSNRSKLKEVDVGSDKAIFHLKEVRKYIKKNFKNHSEVFSDAQLKDFSTKLIEKSNVSEEIKLKHIEDVKRIVEQKD